MVRKFIHRVVFLLLRKSRIIFYKILSSLKVRGSINYIQAVQVVGLGKVIVSSNVSMGYFPSPHFFSTYGYLEARSFNAVIEIGENSHINNGFVAIAESSKISIGKNCLIGTCVEIYDSDFHSLSALERLNGDQHVSKPVRIGDNVFIGSNVKILKGVSIGDGAVIANGAVVTRDVPEYVISAGVPAINKERHL